MGKLLGTDLKFILKHFTYTILWLQRSKGLAFGYFKVLFLRK